MRYTLGRDLHRFAAAWIATNAGSSMVDSEAAKATDLNAMSSYQGITDRIQYGFDGLLGISLIQLAESGS